MKIWRWYLISLLFPLALTSRLQAWAYVNWTSAPGQAEHNQGYYVEDHGYSDNGTLSQVNIWKEWTPFAFAGGGDGWNGWSGNWTGDGGAQNITFMGEAVDSDGSSGIIYYTIHINPPSNPPGIQWSSSPGEVEHNQGYFIEAHGWDGDGDLATVSIWKNGNPFAFAGGGDGWNGWSGNPTGDGGEQWVEFMANSGDQRGNYSGNIYHYIHIKPPNDAPAVWWTNPPGWVSPNSWYTIRADAHDGQGNMTGVHIYKEWVPFAFALNGNGYDAYSDNPDYTGAPGSVVTYMAEAHDSYGASSGYIYQTVHVSNNMPYSSWNPTTINPYINENYTFSASASDVDGNLQQMRSYEYAWEDVGGNWVLRQNFQLFDLVGSGGGPVSRSYTHTGGKPQKWNYQYVVLARDAAGYENWPWVGFGNILNVYLENRRPSDPTLTTAQTTIGLGQSVIISSYGSDLDANATDHFVWWQGPNDGPNTWNLATRIQSPQGAANTTINYSFTPTQLGIYRFKTRENDPYMSSGDITVNLSVIDTTPPNPPTNVHAGGIFSDRIQVLWDLSNSGDVTSYKLFWRPSAGGVESNLTLGINVVGYWVVYLTNNTSYQFYLRAYDGAGNESVPSNVTEAMTAFSATDWDGDGIPDSVELLMGTNSQNKGVTDPVNATIQLKIHKP